jgi:glutamine amidotransferase
VKKICILDYGLGNIKSLYNSLNKIGYKPTFASESKKKNYDIIFIPGVGSFSNGSKLIKKKYLNFLNHSFNKGISLFGICLGMQLLLSEGEENGLNKGLNFVDGKVVKLTNKNKIKLPIVGWGKVNFKKKKEYSFLSKYQNEKFYFIHSYVASLKDKKNELSKSSYNGISYTSAIIKKNCVGTQFHPEKSGEVGLEFLKDWIKRL